MVFAIWKILGQWLDASDWKVMISEAGATTNGQAENAIRGGVTQAK